MDKTGDSRDDDTLVGDSKHITKEGSMKQREAVYKATAEAIEGFEDGMNVNEILDATARAEIISVVTGWFTAGEVDLSDSARAKYDTEEKIKGYVGGLVSNWHRKDTRLNGGVAYTPKNPGSRAGQGDAQIKELRKLLSMHKGTKQEAEIQRFIDARLTQLKADKVKTVEIDTDLLPEELQDLAS